MSHKGPETHPEPPHPHPKSSQLLNVKHELLTNIDKHSTNDLTRCGDKLPGHRNPAQTSDNYMQRSWPMFPRLFPRGYGNGENGEQSSASIRAATILSLRNAILLIGASCSRIIMVRWIPNLSRSRHQAPPPTDQQPGSLSWLLSQ